MLFGRSLALFGQLHVLFEGLVGGRRPIEARHSGLPTLSQAEHADDLGREVFRLLVPEGVGQGRPLDVLDHVGDVAAEGRGIEVLTADDVPANAAR